MSMCNKLQMGNNMPYVSSSIKSVVEGERNLQHPVGHVVFAHLKNACANINIVDGFCKKNTIKIH